MIEPILGDIKFNRKIDQFHRRGRSAVRSEWRLITATHNLIKLHKVADARPETARGGDAGAPAGDPTRPPPPTPAGTAHPRRDHNLYPDSLPHEQHRFRRRRGPALMVALVWCPPPLQAPRGRVRRRSTWQSADVLVHKMFTSSVRAGKSAPTHDAHSRRPEEKRLPCGMRAPSIAPRCRHRGTRERLRSRSRARRSGTGGHRA